MKCYSGHNKKYERSDLTIPEYKQVLFLYWSLSAKKMLSKINLQGQKYIQIWIFFNL